jgi:hypothetical protein
VVNSREVSERSFENSQRVILDFGEPFVLIHSLLFSFSSLKILNLKDAHISEDLQIRHPF